MREDIKKKFDAFTDLFLKGLDETEKDLKDEIKKYESMVNDLQNQQNILKDTYDEKYEGVRLKLSELDYEKTKLQKLQKQVEDELAKLSDLQNKATNDTKEAERMLLDAKTERSLAGDTLKTAKNKVKGYEDKLKALGEDENKLTLKEKDLREKERVIGIKERVIADKEASLASREMDINDREDELIKKENQIKNELSRLKLKGK